MKKLFVLIFLCICSFAHAQKEKISQLGSFDKRPIRYGFYLGFNKKGYSTIASDTIVEPGGGFQLGVLADLRMTQTTSLLIEPGILFSENNIKFPEEDISLGTTHFHLPISLKFRTKRLNNVRGHLLIGASYNYNFDPDKNNEDNGKDPLDFDLEKNVFMTEFGVGANFYFQYFKFSPSIRAVYGLKNEYIGLGSIAKSSLSELKTRGMFLTLTFQ